MKIISDHKEINKYEWAEFVYEHPYGNIFQTPEMFEVYQNTKNYIPVFFLVTDGDKKILGSLLAVIQKEYSGILGYLTSRSIIHGGPLIKNDDPIVLDNIIREYNKVIRKKAIYSQIRNNRSWGNLREVYEKNKFIYEEHLNIFIDLTKPVEELWKEVNSKRKNTIRRADKEGTSFAVKNNEDSLKRCYMILKEVYDRAKLPLPSYDFFLNLLLLEKNSRLLIFCAIHEEKIIGCMLAFAYKNTIYDFYAGSMKKFYNKYPNDLIPWQVFKWGKTNGFKVFNFGGAGKPNIPYGVREYKKKFGGSLVNHGRFQKTHQPLLFKISKIGFKLYQKIK